MKIPLQIILQVNLYLTFINCINLSDVLSKFDEESCIEDDFMDAETQNFLYKSHNWHSHTLIKENTHLDNEPAVKTYLSTINELAQLNNIEYDYYLESEEGPSHSKLFNVILTLGKEKYKGEGSSIKEARRKAAEEAILNTNYIIPEFKEKEENPVLTPTVELNNLATKLGMKVTYLSEDELLAESFVYKQKNTKIPDGKSLKTYNDRLNYTIYHPYERKLNISKENKHGQQFKVGVIVGYAKFIGVGYTLQLARHDAASKALAMLKQLSSKDIDQCIDDGVVCNYDNIKSPISLLYERAQAKGIALNFEIIAENGPAHEKEFVTRCQFGNLEVDGVGRSKKASKKNASENMIEKLKYTEPSNDQGHSQVQSSKKKKKNKKVIKSKIEKFAKDAKSFITSAWEYVAPTDDKTKEENSNSNDKLKKQKFNDDKKKDTNDFKRSLLEVSQDKGISVQYVDLGNEKSKYYSLVFLGIKPNHVCLGDGLSSDLSRQKASLEALNFFHKLGIDNLIPSQETFKYIENMDFGKMYLIDSDITNKEKSKEM